MKYNGKLSSLKRLIGEEVMKGFGKRLTILAVCLLLVGALCITASAAAVQDCPGSCTHQAAVGTTHYDTLAEAIASAESGSSVKLLADALTDAPIVAAKSISLDLGGKTLTGELVFTKGGTVRNGKIMATTGSALQVNGCTVAIEKDARLEGCGTAPALSITADKDAAALVKLSGTVSGKGTVPVIQVKAQEGSCELQILKHAMLTADTNPAIAFDSAGKLDISDGTIQTKKDILTVQIAEDRKTELSVTGGKLLSEAGEAVVITADEKAEVPRDFVTGGTFKKVPASYVPAYCKIRENTDGTYTVISSYTLTFLPGSASGTMEAVKVRCGDAYKLPKCSFTGAQNMDFAGWDIGGKTYAPGDTFTPGSDTSITALWKDHVHSGGKATCLKKALCSVCGKAYGSRSSHSLTYIGGYAATCDKTGLNAHRECTVCGGCFIDGVEVAPSALTVAALGHSWETVDGTPATCTEDGLKQHSKCNTCGSLQLDGSPVKEEELIIPATGHTMEAVAASQATCSEPGIQAHEHCTACDGQFVKGEQVEASQLTTALSSHVLSDWQSDEHYHWKACVDCDEVFRQGTHSDIDADGSCDDCGFTMAGEQMQTPGEASDFSWLLLIPVVIAAAVAIPLAIKKYKK